MPVSKSRGQAVYEQLKAAIVAGSIQPGTQLKVAPLSEQYQVSYSVVREALQRLAGKHLAELAPNQGFRVVDLSAQDLEDITDVRVLVEGEALRRSIAKGGMEWETQVVGAHHRLKRTPVKDADGMVGDDWLDAHAEFHAALIAGGGNRRLERMAAELRDSAEIYRTMSTQTPVSSTRNIAAEHDETAELALGRKADEAVRALEDHIRRTTEILQAAHFTQP